MNICQVGSSSSYCFDVSVGRLLFAIPVAHYTLCALSRVYETGVRRTLSSMAGRLMPYVPSIQNEYRNKVEGQFRKFQEETRRKWACFERRFEAIPPEGLSNQEIVALVRNYERVVLQMMEGHHFSGAVYSPSWLSLEGEAEMFGVPSDSGSSLVELANDLKNLFTYAYGVSFLWNTLHSREFSPGEFINYQLIQMTAHQFGGSAADCSGLVTSGGTESLMTAVRAYLAWGEREKGLAVSDCVIIAPDSIHAAVLKAQKDYGFKLVLVPTDASGAVDQAVLRKACAAHKKQLVALFGSAPSYPKGKMDPISEMNGLAMEHGCGLHIDCCLGGLVVEWLHPHVSQMLSMPGVTSLSSDPHKHGMTPKGCSVLVTKKMPKGENLAFYPIYALPDWTGGIYATSTVAGSQSCVAAFAALIGMLKIGANRYKEIAETLFEQTKQLAQILKGEKGLVVLGDPEVNVVAFGVDPELGYEPGAIYAFTYEMQQRGFSCSNVARDAAHFCVTARFAADPSALAKFKEACKASLACLAEHNTRKKEGGISFPGEAGLYGEIGAALHPEIADGRFPKYLENFLFGAQAVADTVHYYCLARLNPYLE